MSNRFFKSKASFFVYLIGDDGAILLFVEKGQTERRLFAAAPDTEQTAPMIELLAEHPNVPIYVLVDMIDQSYVRHTLPPVASFSIKKLVQRRIDRDFSSDYVTGYLPLGRETSGRKDWSVLLIALSKSPEFTAWVNLVIDQPNHFAGLHLLPVECENILGALHALYQDSLQQNAALAQGEPEKPKKKFLPDLKSKKKNKSETEEPEWQILLSHQKVGGLRQVVLKNKKLIFTRLTQQDEQNNPETLAGNVEQEVQNTIEYLRRLSYNNTSRLDIYLIVAEDVKNLVSLDLASLGNNIAVHALSPFEAASHLGLEQSVLSQDRFGDIVLSAAFGALKKKRLKLAHPYGEKLEKIHKLTQATKYIGILAIIGLLGYSAYAGYNWYQNQSQIDDLQSKKQRKEATLRKLQDAAKDLPADINEVNNLLNLHELLSAPSASPLDLTSSLKSLLSSHTIIRWFHWRISSSIDRDTATSKETLKISLGLEILAEEIEAENPDEQIAKIAEESAQKIKTLFKDFEVTHPPLPGDKSEESGELRLDLDAKEREGELNRGNIVIDFSINGAVPPLQDSEGASS